MPSIPKRSLLIIGIIFAFSTIVCSSGYITPYSLTATAGAPLEETSLPTAFFQLPSETPTVTSAPTDTPDPAFSSPTPTLGPPTATTEPSPTVAPLAGDTPPLQYTAQSGDTLNGLANRFGVNSFEIISDQPIPEIGLINPGQFLLIPQRLGSTSPANWMIPDTEFVYSPSATDFDTVTYVNTFGGYLSEYREYVGTAGWLTGPEIVEKVALDNSISPRLLLALLEYQSSWVLGQPNTLSQTDYPLGYISFEDKGLHKQLNWAVKHLSFGYYEWRAGDLLEVQPTTGKTTRLAPTLNAATAALQYYFSQVYSDENQWALAISESSGFSAQHTTMFGNAWERDAQIGPILPANIEQPQMILPFLRGQRWAYTGGPHGAWEREGPLAALDFAPGSVETGCVDSELWVVAMASGVVARTGIGLVVLDLDGDGNEHTGWVVLYLHLDYQNTIVPGKWVDQTELLGHPSCKGGVSTGTHIHLARKYNGEWILAGGALPFTLSGWVAANGDGLYQGYLVRGDETIKSCTCGSASTHIYRTEDDPY